SLTGGSFMSIADRSILSCWGLKGGKAGAPFRVTVDPGGPNQRILEGLCNDEVVDPGELIRIETTGGGGWGNPLDRPVAEVQRDLDEGKVTLGAAERDYGIVLRDGQIDAAATEAKRLSRKEADGDGLFFDRGPGFATLSGGKLSAEVDH
ncbi:MAG: hydantoinase B/oxoprolinase family protein, partial [Actinomycetia bacterium]|nr:hydantoinase B/oxoprolinase family protein [Actinomycetes bacterium]